jgi:hypothetical protein
VTSGNGTNQDAALIDASSTRSKQDVTLAATLSSSENWLSSCMELKGANPVTPGGNFVQGNERHSHGIFRRF